MIPTTEYLVRSNKLGFHLETSGDYWKPALLSFYNESGPLRLNIPRTEMEVYRLLDNYRFREFFGKSHNLVIGNNLKDLVSFLLHYGIRTKARLLDVKLLSNLDPFSEESYLLTEDPRDLFYKIPWVQKILTEEHRGKIYLHLIEGSFGALSMMENQGLRMQNGDYVYPKYRVGVATSGRFSCTQEEGFFNPHSVPKESSERGRYLPPEGYKMVLADEQAMEMRILGHLSGDKNLLTVFSEDLDIHEIIARRLFKKGPKNRISDEERRIAKQVGFLMIFGGTPYGLAQKANISQKAAKILIRSFFDTFPRVEEWILETQVKSLEQGYIKSIFGRIRKLNGARKVDSELRSMQNFCVQSAAADINCLSLRGIYHLLPKRSKILLHLHDGGVFASPPEEVEEMARVIRLCNENPPGLSIFGIKLQVPLKVKIKVTDRWE